MNGKSFPRPLTQREKEWIFWILPEDRPGYREYRDLIAGMVVIGEGRRGKGEIILGKSGDVPDFSSPLSSVFAYGALETSGGECTISLREESDGQISVEIVSGGREEVPFDFEERRRWSYSTWRPGQECPQCLLQLREVAIELKNGQTLSLALCPRDRRMWIYDPKTGANRLIPATNFHNELMMVKNVRDPAKALDTKRLFVELNTFTDEELTDAFLNYNRLRTKVRLERDAIPAAGKKPSLIARLFGSFRKHQPSRHRQKL